MFNIQQRNDLANRLKNSQSKYTYHVMALATGGIAFSVNISLLLKISDEMYPLGLAIMLWLISIYNGLRHLKWHQTHDSLNISLLEVEAGVYKHSGTHKEKIDLGRDIIIDLMNKASNKTYNSLLLQNWCLYFGTISFIIWRIFVMIP